VALVRDAINRSTFPHSLVGAYDHAPVARDGGGGSVHAIGSVYQLVTDFSNLDGSSSPSRRANRVNPAAPTTAT